MTIENVRLENIAPEGDFMLIEPMKKQEATTKSGIILQDAGDTGATPTLGTVIKAGFEAKFKPGAMLMFRRYSVDEVEVKGLGRFSFIQNGDVICQIKPDEPK